MKYYESLAGIMASAVGSVFSFCWALALSWILSTAIGGWIGSGDFDLSGMLFLAAFVFVAGWPALITWPVFFFSLVCGILFENRLLRIGLLLVIITWGIIAGILASRTHLFVT